MCNGGLTPAGGEHVCVQIFPETKRKEKEMGTWAIDQEKRQNTISVGGASHTRFISMKVLASRGLGGA